MSGQYAVDVGVVASDDPTIEQCDSHRRQAVGAGWRLDVYRSIGEQRRPLGWELRARDLAGPAIDEGVRPVAEQATVGHLGCVELLPHHRLHGIAP